MLSTHKEKFMKKSLVALSIAALSTAAVAQSNVTIYGTADVSAQGTNATTHVGASNGTTGGAFNLKANDSVLALRVQKILVMA